VQPDGDLAGKIVLVRRGLCSFDDKALTVEKYGAAGIIIYDNEEGSGFRPQALHAKLPLAAIDLKAGTELRQILNKDSKYEGKGIHMNFKTSLSPHRTSTGNKISKFSSVGPLYDMALKPDLAGPGGFIFSTLPIPNGGYGVLSGTSMASPYIAGAYALFMEAHGREKGPDFLKEHFQNYAKPANQLGNHLDNPARQGAGLIQSEFNL
jgi:subtilisin family serine protease